MEINERKAAGTLVSLTVRKPTMLGSIVFNASTAHRRLDFHPCDQIGECGNQWNAKPDHDKLLYDGYLRVLVDGSHAKARYSGAVHGTPPSRVASLRRALGSVTTAHSAKRCLTTAPTCDVGSQDPAISRVIDVVNNWFSILNAGPLERARAMGRD